MTRMNPDKGCLPGCPPLLRVSGTDPESEVSYKGHSPACEKWYLIPVAPKVPVWSTCGAPSHPSEELYKQTPSL